jgi:hypothetical protein
MADSLVERTRRAIKSSLTDILHVDHVTLERQTIANATVGFLVGFVLTVVPLVSLVAPLVGGGVAGYRERGGAKAGLLPGALAGAFIAVGAFLLRTGLVALRFGMEGAFPIQGIPLSTLLAGVLVGGALTLVSLLGTVVVAAVGGGLGGLLEDDRSRRRDTDAVSDALPGTESRNRRLGRVFVSLLGGVVTFLAVALGVTAVLDPYIWPSALVGLPVGAVAGVSVAVLTNHVLTTRRERREGRGGTPGAQ